MRTVHLIISGKVQGVFYRASAKEAADRLGIAGTVKNTKEGNVEIVAQASEDRIAEFLAWCRKGPSRAVVDNVQVVEIEAKPFKSFEIIR